MIGGTRPLVTFLVVAYNQEALITGAIRGALSQTYFPLEIILSDDCSTDRTFERMREAAQTYRGHARVVARRNAMNLGIIEHINSVMRISEGELIVAAAGDDISMPHRTEVLVEAYLKSQKRAYSVFSNGTWIDWDGRPLNALRNTPPPPEWLSLATDADRRRLCIVNGCTQAWKREVFDVFGDLPSGVGAEDTTIPFRAALLGEIQYTNERLVHYRRRNTRNFWVRPLSEYRMLKERTRLQQRESLEAYKCRLRDIEYAVAKNIARRSDVEELRAVTRGEITRLEIRTRLRESRGLYNKCRQWAREMTHNPGSAYVISQEFARAVDPVSGGMRFAKSAAYAAFQSGYRWRGKCD